MSSNQIITKNQTDIVCLLASIHENVTLNGTDAQRLQRFISNNKRMIEVVRDEMESQGNKIISKQVEKLLSEKIQAEGASSYTCFWDERTFALGGRKQVDIHFFNEENAYEEEEVAAIKNLSVGQVWTSLDYGRDHTVTRAS